MEVHYNLAMRCIWTWNSWQIRYNIATTMLAMCYVPPGQTHIDRIPIIRRIRDCDVVGGDRTVMVEAVHVPSLVPRGAGSVSKKANECRAGGIVHS